MVVAAEDRRRVGADGAGSGEAGAAADGAHGAKRGRKIDARAHARLDRLRDKGVEELVAACKRVLSGCLQVSHAGQLVEEARENEGRDGDEKIIALSVKSETALDAEADLREGFHDRRQALGKGGLGVRRRSRRGESTADVLREGDRRRVRAVGHVDRERSREKMKKGSDVREQRERKTFSPGQKKKAYVWNFSKNGKNPKFLEFCPGINGSFFEKVCHFLSEQPRV